ncbi:MAG: RNA methyltransferase [Chitinophagales bacterium]|jgi:TrmH family RNA methyltransferase|nr:RNA methyltransferase [Bacteroidota bacterium]MBK7568410.1 RNA methyltransferase [Bacteroidota bacterium]MBP8915469.1 RNA methyltransferase [Chitinophagales bacterium]MBP9220185.1 RNA methyltransferase [Chitinophagales bacterium]MBP9794657.1 RNA methyltransferase [Chitinophagales bacterium]
MLTKARIKHLQNLKLKKYRQNYTEFVIEGDKLITEAFVENANIRLIAATKAWIQEHGHLIPMHLIPEEISEKEMEKISSFKTPQAVIALIEIPKQDIKKSIKNGDWILVLDGIHDPGNLGTIIRSADWFGVHTIVCSEDCVELYNPKVIHATMGSLFRVQVFYENIGEFLQQSTKNKYAATLNGENIFNVNFEKTGILIIGSESHGIRPEVLKHCTTSISIPAYGKAESLNAAVATSILLSRIRG